MKVVSAIVGIAFLSSCTFDQYEATSASGNHVKETLINPGGTGSIKRSDGSSLVYDNQTSWRDTTNMVTTVAGGIVVGNVSKAKTASDNAAATAQQAATLSAQTQQAQISATAAAAASKTAAQAAHFQTAAQAGLFTPVPLPTPH